MAHAAEHLLKVLSADRYTAARAVKDDGYAFILALGVAGYNGSIEWRQGVLRAYAQISLQ
jgi:hypothetical protein